ncbi:hypothetical protein MUK42_00488 [Musa troglodytarum]|uniref:Uncharacterized protein n=1 Tax=Musa troglodytarum TaxID=320322 RepID=A0A9E7FAB8_9LILI|nr:hypothetical protein MUK42_00488 [Musa troglodytarum]
MWRRGEARARESFRPFRLFAWRASNASSLAFPTPLPDASSSSPTLPCLDQLSAFQEDTTRAATDLGIRGPMDRDKKKRGREEPRERGAAAVAEAELPRKKGKRIEEAEAVPESCRVDIVDVTDVFRPPGLFEFPWQKGEVLLLPEPPHDRDLGDAFFSSLVDGSSAALGVPGDRLSPTAPGPFCLPEEPSDGELDGGVDCIWSSVLRQPLSTVYSKNCSA